MIIVLLVISPYVIRNYIHFNQFIIVKSLGYNLWKGNNELSKVEGYENYEKATFSKLKFKINNIDKDKYYEFRRDKVFLDEALKNLKEDSIYYVKLYFKKIFSFFFIDMNSSYPNYYNIFHFIPALILGVLSFPGFIIALKKRSFNLNIFLFYLCINLLIFSVFFILPRYKLIILPTQIILASYFINSIFSKIKKN